MIAGIASLQDFFPEPQLVRGKWVKRNKKTGKVTLMNPQPGRARILAEELPVVNGGGKNPSPPTMRALSRSRIHSSGLSTRTTIYAKT